MENFDFELPRFILDMAKTIGGFVANHRKDRTASSSPINQTTYFVIETPPNASVVDCEERKASLFVQANVAVERALVVNAGTPELSELAAAPAVGEEVPQEDNKLLAAAIADDEQDKGKRRRPSIIDGYAEEVAMKRLGKRGDGK